MPGVRYADDPHRRPTVLEFGREARLAAQRPRLADNHVREQNTDRRIPTRIPAGWAPPAFQVETRPDGSETVLPLPHAIQSVHKRARACLEGGRDFEVNPRHAESHRFHSAACRRRYRRRAARC